MREAPNSAPPAAVDDRGYKALPRLHQLRRLVALEEIEQQSQAAVRFAAQAARPPPAPPRAWRRASASSLP